MTLSLIVKAISHKEYKKLISKARLTQRYRAFYFLALYLRLNNTVWNQ